MLRFLPKQELLVMCVLFVKFYGLLRWIIALVV